MGPFIGGLAAAPGWMPPTTSTDCASSQAAATSPKARFGSTGWRSHDPDRSEGLFRARLQHVDAHAIYGHRQRERGVDRLIDHQHHKSDGGAWTIQTIDAL